jgi:type IV secretory pathway VirB4 component
VTARLPWHRASTAHLAGLYPFPTSGGPAVPGTLIGADQHGEAFCFDPFELYAARALTNPNMLIAGMIGAGKSSLVKTLLWRQQAWGRAAWVADPKGEYGPLAAASGVTPIRLGPGLPARLNPFDSTGGDPAADRDRWSGLLAALAATALGRALRPAEHAAAGLALTAATPARGVPLLGGIITALLNPAEAHAAELRLTAARLADESRDVALALRRLCHGDLAGIVDGPTTIRPGVTDPLVVLDLSAIYQRSRDALPLVMTCATAWLQHAVTAAAAPHRYVVLDEAWALLAQLDTARWLQASMKLARAHGVANVIVLHRLSDLTAAGDAGSETAALARGLLADTGVRVVYHQPHSELAAAQTLLGLTPGEAGLLPHLEPGTGLWQIGGAHHLVAHRLAASETGIADTSQRMTG